MVFDKVKEIIVNGLSVEESLVTMDANLRTTLGADSLDAVELIMALEEAFELSISDEESAALETVGDIVKYIEERK